MRRLLERSGIVIVALCAASSIARADEIDDLVAKGQELAKQSEWTQAIDAFKQADAKRPRALHACMIGLAYTRRELWPQAELFFARCHARSSAADPLPDWLAEAESQLATKLAAATIPAIELAVTPPTATIAVSGFPGDEAFTAGRFHLAPGHYSLTIATRGYNSQHRELDVVAGRDQALAVALVVTPTHSPAAKYALGIGGGLALVGGVLDLAAVAPLSAESKKSALLYDRDHAALNTWKGATIGCYVGAGVALGVGIWLLSRQQPPPVEVSAQLDRNGGAIAISWTR